MPARIAEFYPLVVFAVLAAVKGLVEIYASRGLRRGGIPSSRTISVIFLTLGALTPVLIVGEVLAFHRRPPVPLAVGLAAAQIALWGVRWTAIRTLGRFYSVDIRITEEHRLVTSGIYRFFRHPIYLVALIENALYPAACGAWLTSILMTVLGTPPLLIRLRQEETTLLETFGGQYRAYRRSTWL